MLSSFVMDNPFKIGDVVQLKSGGPHMTVTEISGGLTGNTPSVYCVWQVNNVTHRDSFPPEALQPGPSSGVSSGGTFDRT